LGVVDLYAHYQSWCRFNHVRPFASKPFSRVAKDEIEITFGLKVRHDLRGENQGAGRAWRRLALVGHDQTGRVENECCSFAGYFNGQ
jgi:hypothetical protein